MLKTLISRSNQALHVAALPRLRLTRARADAPLFVIGSGRSGNTLVRRVLMASAQIHIPPETFVLGDLIDLWPRTTMLSWRERVWLFCAHFEKHAHWPTFDLPNLDEFAAEARYLRPHRLRPLIEFFYRYLAKNNGSAANRWGDKTPWNTYHLPAIGQMFPDARYLWLVRDGRDVALSYRDAGLIDGLPEAAQRWCEANAACSRFARWSPNVLKVHYEDIATASDPAFRRIFEWAALDYSPEFLTARPAALGDVEQLSHHARVADAISSGSVGKWRAGSDAGALAELPPSFHACLARLGYT